MEEKKIIRIFNPQDLPFGPLSNDYVNQYELDGKKWPSVTNYILSNMLIIPSYRLAIQVADTTPDTQKINIEEKMKKIIKDNELRKGMILHPDEIKNLRQNLLEENKFSNMDVYQLYHYYLGSELKNITTKAFDLAYSQKINSSVELQKILLESKNRLIVYESEDLFLGMDTVKNIGNNLIGKIIMQIRSQLFLKYNKKQNDNIRGGLEEDIFNAYIAYSILLYEINNGFDIDIYLGKNSDRIIKIFKQKYKVQEHPLGISRDELPNIIEQYERNQLPFVTEEMKSPGLMSYSLRQFKYNEIIQKSKSRRESIIMKIYVKYVIKNANPKISSEDLKEQLLNFINVAPNIEAYLKLKDNIIDLYENKKLPSKLMKTIDSLYLDIPNISENIDIPEKYLNKKVDIDRNIDPLKEIYDMEPEDRKIILINRLRKYTGKSFEKYQNWDIEKLEKYIEKYRHGKKSVDEKMGTWIVLLKHKKYNRVEIIDKISGGNRPDLNVFEKYAEEYNKTHPDEKVKKTQFFLKFEPVQNFEKYEKTNEYDFDNLHETYTGFTYRSSSSTPIIISDDLSRTEINFRSFSPLITENIIIEDLEFPSIIFYLQTMLLTQSGYYISKNSVVKRGRKINEARNILIVDNNTYLPMDQVRTVVQKDYQDTYIYLIVTYARRALDKKFEDSYFQNLLLSTRDDILVWADIRDKVLGFDILENDNYQYKNYVGKILDEIRTRIETFRAANPYPIITDVKYIYTFIQSDVFMKKWVEMRTIDICKIISKFKQYLFVVDNKVKNLDEDFITNIIDNIYQPCSSLSNTEIKNIQKVPLYYTRFIQSMPDMELVPRRNYSEEINAIYEQKNLEISSFWGIPYRKYEPFTSVVNKSKNPVDFVKKQNEIYQNYLRQDNPSKEEVKEYKKKMEQQLNVILQDEPLVNPKANDEFENKMRLKWSNFMENKIPTNIPLEEKNRLMSNFEMEQNQERKKHYGYVDKNRTQKEITEFKSRQGILSKKIHDIKKERDEELKSHYGYLDNISQIIWNRIIVMCYFIILQMKVQNEQDVRNVLISAEKIVSGVFHCKNFGLQTNGDNCIVEAIINLLSKIRNFKTVYSDNTLFKNEDIDLAVSIILNSEFTKKRIRYNFDKDNGDENLDESIMIDSELRKQKNKIEYNLNENIEEEDNEDETEETKKRKNLLKGKDYNPDLREMLDDENSQDEEDERLEDSEYEADEQDDRDSVEFGFGSRDDSLVKIKISLRELGCQEKDLDKTARYMIEKVEFINTYTMNSHIKWNRINFFSSLTL